MMLYNIDTKGWEGHTAWCVPTAISFLTGIPLIHSHSRAAFIQNKNLKDVASVYSDEACILIHEQGFIAHRINLEERYDKPCTLIRFMKEREPYEKVMPLMIVIQANNFSHMLACHYNYCADNWTMKPTPIDKFPNNRKFVTEAWVISKK